MMVIVLARSQKCPSSDSVNRQSFGKACSGDAVLRHAKADGTGHHPDRGFAQLHQRLQISDVLRRERNEDKGLHSKHIALAFRTFLTLFNEVGLCRGQTRTMPQVEHKPPGGGREVFCGKVCKPATFPPRILETELGAAASTTSSRDTRNPHPWFDGTLLYSRSCGRMMVRRVKISGRR